ncbi:MAG: hypothetical protein JWN52_518 [Actinomycetia bacterium]|jgi:hypothetical protein|nr:hypothetical protein [Actinomycetes bacterium]
MLRNVLKHVLKNVVSGRKREAQSRRVRDRPGVRGESYTGRLPQAAETGEMREGL